MIDIIDLRQQVTSGAEPDPRGQRNCARGEAASMLTGRYPLKNLRMGSRRQTSVPVIESFDLKPGRILARKYEVGFGGNLKLTLALSLGLLSPREDAIVSLAAGGQHGYTFAPG